jgi:FkbM family methyltransferase
MSILSTLSRSIRRKILEKTIVQPLGVAFCAPADGVGQNVMAAGTYEPDAIEILKTIARGDVMLDVGANIGTHSVALAAGFRRILSFEPNKALCLVIQANAMVAGAKNIESFPVGLSDEARTSKLYFPGGNFSWGNVGGHDEWPSVEVELANGDTFLSSHLSGTERISFIKIDVEGHEISVLRGLTETIKRDQPTIAYEALSADAAIQCRELLSSFGYSTFLAMVEAPRGSILKKLLWLLTAKPGLIDAKPATISHCLVAKFH